MEHLFYPLLLFTILHGFICMCGAFLGCLPLKDALPEHSICTQEISSVTLFEMSASCKRKRMCAPFPHMYTKLDEALHCCFTDGTGHVKDIPSNILSIQIFISVHIPGAPSSPAVHCLHLLSLTCTSF